MDRARRRDGEETARTGGEGEGDRLTRAQVTACGPRAPLNLTIVVCKVAVALTQQWPAPG